MAGLIALLSSLAVAPVAPGAASPHSHSCACGMGCKTACCCAPKTPAAPAEPAPEPGDDSVPDRLAGCASVCACGPQPDVPTPPGNEHRRLPESLLGLPPVPTPTDAGSAAPPPPSTVAGRLPDSPGTEPPELAPAA